MALTEELVKGCGLFGSEPHIAGNLSLDGGYKINYEIHGSGSKRIALIMGFMASMGSWAQIVAHFTHVEHYSILVLDNRGVGFSTNGSSILPERYTTSGMAQDFIHVLSHIGWTQEKSVHLVGCSMGGMIAMESAFKDPSRFKTLMLLATCAQFKNPPRTLIESGYKWANFIRPKRTIQEQLDVLLGDLYSDDAWLNAFDSRFPNFSNTFRNRWLTTPPSGIYTLIGQGCAVMTHYVTAERLKFIGEHIPTTAVVGTLDKMISPECTDILGRLIPGCRVVKFEGKGHGIPTESEIELRVVMDETFAST